MKKVFIITLSSALLIATIASNPCDTADLTYTNESPATLSTETNFFPEQVKFINMKYSLENPSDNLELIQSDDHFQIYKYVDTMNQYLFHLLDTNGNIVYSESTTKPLSITMIQDHIIEIKIGYY